MGGIHAGVVGELCGICGGRRIIYILNLVRLTQGGIYDTILTENGGIYDIVLLYY